MVRIFVLLVALVAVPVQADAQASRRGRTCEAEIGAGRAAALVRQCRDVSLASRPPCNVENSCTLIREEIRRSCALLSSDAPPFCRQYVDDEEIDEEDDG